VLSEAFTGRLTNLRQDIAARQDTSGDKFSIELDGQTVDNRGIAGELIIRRAEKIKNRFGDDVWIGRRFRFVSAPQLQQYRRNDCAGQKQLRRAGDGHGARHNSFA
jgi:hypothetical protein